MRAILCRYSAVIGQGGTTTLGKYNDPKQQNSPGHELSHEQSQDHVRCRGHVQEVTRQLGQGQDRAVRNEVGLEHDQGMDLVEVNGVGKEKFISRWSGFERRQL